MAGEFDVYIQNAHRQIDSFPGSDVEDEDMPDVTLPEQHVPLSKSNHCDDIIQLSIEAVELEIEKYTQLIEDRQQQLLDSLQPEGLRNLMQHEFRNSSLERFNLKEEIWTLEERIKLIRQLSGIEIQKSSARICKQDKGSVTKQHVVQGKSESLQFDVRYLQITSLRLPNRASSCKTHHLQISINPACPHILEQPVHRLVEANDTASLLGLLRAYSLERNKHKTLCETFQDKYLGVVISDLDDDGMERLVIASQRSHVSWVITWSYEVTDLYTVKTNACLSTEIDKSGAGHNDGVLKQAPRMFTVLCNEKGQEQAIQSIVDIVMDS